MVIIGAALKGVPDEMLEAGRIDPDRARDAHPDQRPARAQLGGGTEIQPGLAPLAIARIAGQAGVQLALVNGLGGIRAVVELQYVPGVPPVVRQPG